MMNFLLGLSAGGLIAGVATITAARHPEVQARLGLVTVSTAALMPAAHMPPGAPCAQASPRSNAGEPVVGQPDMLFSRRRFWFVAP